MMKLAHLLARITAEPEDPETKQSRVRTLISIVAVFIVISLANMILRLRADPASFFSLTNCASFYFFTVMTIQVPFAFRLLGYQAAVHVFMISMYVCSIADVHIRRELFPQLSIFLLCGSFVNFFISNQLVAGLHFAMIFGSMLTSMVYYSQDNFVEGVYQYAGTKFFREMIAVVLRFPFIFAVNFVQNSLRRRRIQQLIQLNDEKTRLGSCKDTFFTTVAHELRNPLNALLGIVDILFSTPAIDVQLLKTGKYCGEVLLNLIGNVLDASKFEAGKMETKKRAESLRKQLRQIHRMYKPLFKQKSLYLRLIVEEGLPELLEYDSFRINQVLINLIGNGAKFTKKGGLTIHLSWHPARAPSERPAQLEELLTESAREQLQNATEEWAADEETTPGRWCEDVRYHHEPHSNNLRGIGGRTMSHPASPLLCPSLSKRGQIVPATDVDLHRHADSAEGDQLEFPHKQHLQTMTPNRLRKESWEGPLPLQKKGRPYQANEKLRRSKDSAEAIAGPSVSEMSSQPLEIGEKAPSGPVPSEAKRPGGGRRKKSEAKWQRRSESSRLEEEEEESPKEEKMTDLAVDLPQDGFIKIQIVDTGIGITEEARSRLFQPFVQANSGIASQYGGTGLGLYISKTIVCELMGGQITIDSKPTEGSNFIVVIPMTTTPSAASREDPATLQKLSALRFEGKRALVIDDQDYNIAMMKALLCPHGLEVAIATDGVQGFACYQELRPHLDVIITDLRMPNMSGQELLQAIRKHEAEHSFSSIPIIVLTGEPSEAERVRCVSQLQASLYFRKPMVIGEFLPALARLLQKQSLPLQPLAQPTAHFPSDTEVQGQSQGQGQKQNQNQSQSQSQSHMAEQGQDILVVDDDVFSNGVVTNMLRINGYRVVQMFSCETAVGFYKSNYTKIKLILLDSLLTDGRGVDVLNEIRQFEVRNSLKSVKVISLSGQTVSAQENEYSGLKVYKFLVKPISLKHLIAAVSD